MFIQLSSFPDKRLKTTAPGALGTIFSFGRIRTLQTLKHLNSGQPRAIYRAGGSIKMKTKLLALALLAGSSMFAQTRFSIGVHIGGYNPGYYAPAPYPYVADRPPCPGPDYSWTDGYWVEGPGRGAWVNGYWARQSIYGRGYEQDRDRGFDRDRYQHREFERDHRSYDRGDRYNERNNRYNERGDRYNGRDRGNGYGNGFRNH